MWKKGCSDPCWSSRGIQRSANKQHVFWDHYGAHVSVCPHSILKHDRSIFSIILMSMWKKGCSDPWGRVSGILNALNTKVRQQATCFLRSLRCTCFVCPHCVLKHDRSLFSIILTSMWKKGCSDRWGSFRDILNALNPTVRQQPTCFLRSLRCTCFRLNSLCP